MNGLVTPAVEKISCERESKGASVPSPSPKTRVKPMGKMGEGSPLPCKRNRGARWGPGRLTFAQGHRRLLPPCPLSRTFSFLAPLNYHFFCYLLPGSNVRVGEIPNKGTAACLWGGVLSTTSHSLPSFTYSSSGTSFSLPACLVFL